MKKIQYRIEYFLVRVVEQVLQSLPRPAARRAGELIGVLLSRVMRSRRALVLDNLRRALPERAEADLQRIASRFWRNLGRTAVEFVRLDDVTDKGLAPLSYEGVEHVRAAQALGRGLIFVGFHFGNWEVSSIACHNVSDRVVAIARPIKNPLVDAWVHRKRARSGTTIIMHRQAVKASLRALREKSSVGILSDQNLYTGGVFVDFFGRPAATTTLPALLHARTGAPVIVVYCVSTGNGFKAVFEPMLDLPPMENQEEQIVAHTQQVSKALEDVIRSAPENWFWIHNRWKRSPEPA